MTEMMNLRGLLEKSPDADLLREMIGFAALLTPGRVGTRRGPARRSRLETWRRPISFRDC